MQHYFASMHGLTWLVQIWMAISTVEPAIQVAAMVRLANWPPTEKRVSPGNSPPHTPSVELPFLQGGGSYNVI